MKELKFVSTTDALAYLIKRLDGSKVTFTDEIDGGGCRPAEKSLSIKTRATYGYTSDFRCKLPMDAPAFTTFADFLRYLESINKCVVVNGIGNFDPSTILADSDKLLWVSGIVVGDNNVEALLFVKDASQPDVDQYNNTNWRFYVYGVWEDSNGDYQRGYLSDMAIHANYASDSFIYEDYPTFSSKPQQ